MRFSIRRSLALALFALAGQVAPASPGVGADAVVIESPAVDERAVERLLERGRTALREGRMLGPAGDNALEFTVRALEIDRSHALAQSAMDDLYSFVTAAIDGAIERRRYAEAERLLSLLERGRPDSLVAKSLRARLVRGVAGVPVVAG